ncbi:unnamed protein product [Arctogadus glacialis]
MPGMLSTGLSKQNASHTTARTLLRHLLSYRTNSDPLVLELDLLKALKLTCRTGWRVPLWSRCPVRRSEADSDGDGKRTVPGCCVHGVRRVAVLEELPQATGERFTLTSLSPIP